MSRSARLAICLLAAACAPGGARTSIPEHELFLAITGPAQGVEPGAAFPLTVVRIWDRDLVPAEWSDRALAPLVIRPQETTRREDEQRVEETRRYLAYAFRREDVIVPAVQFTARPRGGGPERAVSSNELKVTVHPVLTMETAGPPELPGDLLAEPSSILPWTSAGAAALAAAALLAYLRYRSRRTQLEEAVPPAIALPAPEPQVPPHVQALERLQRLRERDPVGFDDTQAYYVEAAELMREYVHARFDLRACEMTTEELVGHDTTQRVLEGGQRGALSHFLKHCDLVKFARYTPPSPQRKEMLEQAEGFVLETQGGERA